MATIATITNRTETYDHVEEKSYIYTIEVMVNGSTIKIYRHYRESATEAFILNSIEKYLYRTYKIEAKVSFMLAEVVQG